MKLHSQSFPDGAVIPERNAFGRVDLQNHVALADNFNPHLAWDDVPDGARSFVVICVDPDVPSKPDDVNQTDREVPADLSRVPFYHWVLVNLPADTRELREGDYSRGITPRGKAGPLFQNGVLQGLNGFTDWFAQDRDMNGDYFGYDGPCPPWNDALVHRYIFTVYALDVAELPVSGRFTGDQVLAALQGHILEQASITGTYTLNPRLHTL